MAGDSPQELTAHDEWCDEWSGTDVNCDQPALPGFNLARRLWSNLNHFRTCRGQCAANLALWHNTVDNGSPHELLLFLIRFPGGLTLQVAGDGAIEWLGI